MQRNMFLWLAVVLLGGAILGGNPFLAKRSPVAAPREPAPEAVGPELSSSLQVPLVTVPLVTTVSLRTSGSERAGSGLAGSGLTESGLTESGLTGSGLTGFGSDGRAPDGDEKAIDAGADQPVTEAAPAMLASNPSGDVLAADSTVGPPKLAMTALPLCPDAALQPLVTEVQRGFDGEPVWVLRDGRRLRRAGPGAAPGSVQWIGNSAPAPKAVGTGASTRSPARSSNPKKKPLAPHK